LAHPGESERQTQAATTAKRGALTVERYNTVVVEGKKSVKRGNKHDDNDDGKGGRDGLPTSSSSCVRRREKSQ
jgi:hypothetical protein